MHDSPSLQDLLAVAYKKELAASRRLARCSDLSAHAALQQTLQHSAGGQSLASLIEQRHALQQAAVAALAARRQQQVDRRAQRHAATVPHPQAWLAWFDGATLPNPGRMGVGGVLQAASGVAVRVEICAAAGYGDSSQAEYLALIAVLEATLPHQPAQLVVYGDSQVVINDMRHSLDGGARSLRAYRQQAQALVAQLAAVTLVWIPRHKNAAADALSQRALQAPPAHAAAPDF